MSISEKIGTAIGFAVVAGLPAAFFIATSQPDKAIAPAQEADAILYADIHQSNFRMTELKNVYQDRFGVQMVSAGGSDGVSGGQCYYMSFSPQLNTSNAYVNTSKGHQVKKDATASLRVRDDLFVVTPISVISKDVQSWGNTVKVPDGCTLNVARYSDVPVASPLGSNSYRIDSRTYLGAFVPNQKTSLFEGRFALRVHRAPWFRSTGTCSYSVYFDGKTMDSPRGSPVAYYVSDSGKAYKVDVSRTQSGFTTTSDCTIRVESFDLISASSSFRPPSINRYTPAEDPKIQAVATRLANENPQLTITREYVEEIELQPVQVVELTSDASVYKSRKSSLSIEFEMKSGESNTFGGGVTIFGALNGSLGKSLERSLTSTIKAGDEIESGVMLDGARCRRWETYVSGVEVHAKVSAPQIGLPEIPFTYLDSINFQARSLCDPSAPPLGRVTGRRVALAPQ